MSLRAAPRPGRADPAGAPGLRPDFYLWRLDPPMAQVAHHGALFWREPGVVWDAKYYRERERAAAPSSPVKRMIADLTLLGENQGTLLFAFLTGADEQHRYAEDAEVERHGPGLEFPLSR